MLQFYLAVSQCSQYAYTKQTGTLHEKFKKDKTLNVKGVNLVSGPHESEDTLCRAIISILQKNHSLQQIEVFMS